MTFNAFSYYVIFILHSFKWFKSSPFSSDSNNVNYIMSGKLTVMIVPKVCYLLSISKELRGSLYVPGAGVSFLLSPNRYLKQKYFIEI